MTFSAEELYARENFATNYDQFVYIVHKQDSSYEIADPAYKNGIITGKRTELEAFNPKESSRRERKGEIHIYPHSNSELIAPVSQTDSTIKLYKEDIKGVEMFAKKRGGLLSIFLTLLSIIGIILGLIVLLFIGLIASSDGSGSSSSNGGGGGGSGGGGGGSTTTGNGGSCYIATMTYGSYEAPEVIILRKFRDQVLAPTLLGRTFISWYYQNSPSFVERHRDNTLVHRCSKAILDPFVSLLKTVLK